MIEVSGLRKSYGNFEALRGVDFSIERGEVVGFLGPNGAGKTTTMKILTGYIYPTSGKAAICGYDVVNQSLEVRRRIGYLPESAPLYADMQPREFLNSVAAIHGIPVSERAKRVDEVADRCGVSDVLSVPIGHLSKGYRQRVGIAFTLLHSPDLLILDEPTSGLDPNQITEIRDLLKEIGKEKTVILSTHIMREVEATCSRVLIINQGKIVADAAPAELQKGDVLVVRGSGTESAAAKQQLATIADVSAVDIEADGEQGFRARLHTANHHTGSEVFKLATAQGWVLSELRTENASLEDVFHQLTSVN